MAAVGPPDEEALRRFYRSFHKHGAGSWAKVARDAKMTAEQCELLHKQHQSFLSLPAKPELEEAFVGIVNDHYNATQKNLREEQQPAEEEAPAKSGKGRKDADTADDEAQVATSSQKPRRTPKPTRERLAAEEEQQARRQATPSRKGGQATPKSAKAKSTGKAPPSPPAGEWPGSQRKRSRRLFEEPAEGEAPRYRSPNIDRWRGRNTDVDEGVDALLSLASGAHAAANVDEAAGQTVAGSTADPEADAEGARDGAGREDDGALDTPKRPRGSRVGRSTPTPSATPVKGSARAAAAAASGPYVDGLPAPATTGLRSPRGRSNALAAGVLPAPGALGVSRATSSGGRPRHGQLGSPTTSSKGGAAGDAAGAAAAAAAAGGGGGSAAVDSANGEAGSRLPPGFSGGEDALALAGGDATAATAAAAAAPHAAAAGAHAAAAAAAEPAVLTGPTGRPVRRRKPTAIALAAAAQADDEEVGGGRARGPIAAVAAAVAATGMGLMDYAGPGSGGAADLLSNTAAMLAGVPPVRTRTSGRMSTGAPGSRRAGDRHSSPAPYLAAGGGGGALLLAGSEQQGEAGAADSGTDAGGAGASGEERGPPPARGRGGHASTSGGAAGAPGTARVLSVAMRGPPQHAPPGRARRRKSLPERLPPMADALKVLTAVIVPPPGLGLLGADGAPPAPITLPVGPDGEPMLPAEAALRHCLSSTRARRWAMYEFVYSAIDRPWFLRNELLDYCNQMQLPATRLTRLEWSVLRGAMGRPRRLSLAFLREERILLEGHRERARIKYEEVDSGIDLPCDLPRQLRVGDVVTARHSLSGQLYDGQILTVKPSKYRVQFDRGELMSEVVRDTEVAPRDPNPFLPVYVAAPAGLLGGVPHDPRQSLAARDFFSGLASARQLAAAPLISTWPITLESQLMREPDMQAIQEAQRALDAKTGLVSRLAQLNAEAAAGQHTDERGGRTENFQLQYSNAVLQLKETNAMLEAAMARLQGRGTQIIATTAATSHAQLLQQQRHQQQLHAQLQQLPPPPPAPATPPPPPAAAAAAQQQADAGGAGGVLGTGERAVLVPTTALGEPAPLGPGQTPTPTPPPLSAQPSGSELPGGSGGSGLALPPPQAPMLQTRASSGKAAALQAAAGMPSSPLAAAAQRGAEGQGMPPAPFTCASPFGLSAQQALPLLLLSAATPAQLVEAALAEARLVVDACRGRAPDAAPPHSLGLQPPGAPGAAAAAAPPPPLPLLMLQAPGGAPVPLIVPPGGAQPTAQAWQPQLHVAGLGEQQHASASSGAGRPGEGPAGAHAAPAASALGSGTVELSASLPEGLRIKEEPGHGVGPVGSVELQPAPPGSAPDAAAAGLRPAGSSGAQPAPTASSSSSDLHDVWLREVIVGCVGVLFTIQRVTGGAVGASTIAEALDLAVRSLRVKAEGNEGLYSEIVQSVQGLKAHLTRSLA